MSPPTSTQTEPRDALASLRINRAPETRRKSGSRWWKFLLLITMLGVGGWFGYQWAESSGWLNRQAEWMPEIMQNRVEVRLESVKVQKGRSADAVVVATGYLRSRRQAMIGSRAVGRINILYFDTGDKVIEGAVLAELDHKDLDASLAAAGASVARSKAAVAEQEIAIEKAHVDKERTERLWNSRSVSESEYDLVRFAYLSAVARRDSMLAEITLAEAQQRQAEQLKENMFIRAPFDGTVISKDAEVGESIMPGGMGGGSGRGSVATIADLANLEIECDVQEDFISRVSESQEADISIDAVPDKKYHGTVRKIIPMGDRARATIKVQVVVNDADELLFPEMSGTVYFLPTEKELEINDEPRMFCPAKAIAVDSAGRQFVWIADKEKRAQKIEIVAGDERDGQCEVTQGLTGDERVIANPKDLQVGAPLKIVD